MFSCHKNRMVASLSKLILLSDFSIRWGILFIDVTTFLHSVHIIISYSSRRGEAMLSGVLSGVYIEGPAFAIFRSSYELYSWDNRRLIIATSACNSGEFILAALHDDWTSSSVSDFLFWQCWLADGPCIAKVCAPPCDLIVVLCWAFNSTFIPWWLLVFIIITDTTAIIRTETQAPIMAKIQGNCSEAIACWVPGSVAVSE